MKTACLPLFAALSWAMASSTLAAVPERAGEVTFMIGEARITEGPDAGNILRRGSAVHPGQQIETNGNGHLHIRFVDGAAVAVRPMTRLRIDDYRYSPSDPSQNRIRFFLQEGALRSITGKAGEANKDRFRINTPVAAIGIRGTDFNVQTTDDLTRASLFQGAIVLSPLGEQCSALALGPCKGATAIELDERLRTTYALEAGVYDTMAQLVPKRLGVVVSSQLMSTAIPESTPFTQPTTPLLAEATDVQQQNGRIAVETVSASRAEKLAEIAPIIFQPAPPPEPIYPGEPDIKPPPAIIPPTEIKLAHEANPHIWWGRWKAYADPTNPGNTYAAVNIPGRREDIGANTVTALLRTYLSGQQLPVAGGEHSFALSRYEAQTLNGGILTPALITAASLSMDFDKKQFKTHLSVLPSNSALVNMSANGRIEQDGRFYSSGGQEMRLSGGIANRGQQAGYAFERQLDINTLLLGTTAWTR